MIKLVKDLLTQYLYTQLIALSKMQIDRTNFKTHYEHIAKTIKNCDIISFDCQFTGLVTQLKKIEGTFPDYKQYYQRIKETALNFKIIQLGLTTFTFNQNGDYVPQSFNIYLTPFVTVENYNNVMIAQVESLQFLANHKLDFQRVFTKGLTPSRIIKPFEYRSHQYQNTVPSFDNDFFFNEEDQKHVDKIETQLAQMKGSNKFQKIDFKNHAIMTYINNKHGSSLYLKKQKKLIKYEFLVKVHDVQVGVETIKFQHQEVTKKVQTMAEGQKNIQVKQQLNVKTEQKKVQKAIENNLNKVAEKIEQKLPIKVQTNLIQKVEQKKQVKNIESQKVLKQQNSKLEQKQIKISEESIASIIKIILDSKKPLIGHFPCLDLGLFYHTFLEDLPQAYEDFCKKVNEYFPYIFDTKVISRRIQNQLKGIKVDLKSLYLACYNKKLLQPYSNIKFDEIQEYLSSDSNHQAGYDSFITGCAFIGMANFLNGNDKQQKINFQLLKKQNKLLYSRYVGQVSLCEPYCEKSSVYQKSILIAQILKNGTTKWKQIAKVLSKYGTLAVYEDHQQTYFVYEEECQQIDKISITHPQLNLKRYSKRKMIKARQMYKQQKL